MEPLHRDVQRVWDLYWQIDAVGWAMTRDLAVSPSGAALTQDEAEWLLDALTEIEQAVRRRQAAEAKSTRT